MTRGIREAIKNNSTTALSLLGLVVICGLVYSLRSSSFAPPSASTKAFYTVDDGATVFVEDMKKAPPFERDGKTAYRVWMFTCDGGKTRFAGYLERYTPEAKARFDSTLASKKPGEAGAMPQIGPADVEVKKPGKGNPWVNRANLAEASKVTQVKCTNGELEIVMP